MSKVIGLEDTWSRHYTVVTANRLEKETETVDAVDTL